MCGGGRYAESRVNFEQVSLESFAEAGERHSCVVGYVYVCLFINAGQDITRAFSVISYDV